METCRAEEADHKKPHSVDSKGVATKEVVLGTGLGAKAKALGFLLGGLKSSNNLLATHICECTKNLMFASSEFCHIE